MTIDEQDLGRLLEETAELSSAPRFTSEDLTRRAGRRRARNITTVAGAVAAVAAVGVIVPSALSGHSQTPAIAPPSVPIQMSFTVAVNGRTGELPFGGRAAEYVIAPAENLAIAVDMTIPPHPSTKVTALWMGITNGLLTAGPNGPAPMAPILIADTRASLGPGSHRFTLHWRAPTGLRSGTTRQLFAEVAWSHGATGRLIAEFNVRYSLSIQRLRFRN